MLLPRCFRYPSAILQNRECVPKEVVGRHVSRTYITDLSINFTALNYSRICIYLFLPIRLPTKPVYGPVKLSNGGVLFPIGTVVFVYGS
jgi:hypothetical protein